MQRYERLDRNIRLEFERMRRENPKRFERRLNLGWNNCLFGFEEMERSLERLARFGVQYVEIGGYYGGENERCDPVRLNKLLADHKVTCSGICGLFYDDNTLSSPDRFIRNRAKDYIAHELELCKEIGADYLLVVPGSTGRMQPFNATDYDRAVAGLRDIAGAFVENGVMCAIETINSGETQMVNTIAETIRFIRDVGHPGIGHINGDLYHMMLEEPHIGQAILEAGDYLVNLHLADSNRRPIGQGALDIDTVIRALYLIGFNAEHRYVTAEPIGMGRHARALLDNRHDPAWLDERVRDSTNYFREREEAVLAL